MMMVFVRFFAALLVVLAVPGCASVGQEFPVNRVLDIRIGETTQEAVRSLFGSPWRVGLEDGKRTWTYGKYNWSAFAPTSTQDLVIRFDPQGRVSSYVFNTTEHEQKR